jgi:hypothetical protein
MNAHTGFNGSTAIAFGPCLSLYAHTALSMDIHPSHVQSEAGALHDELYGALGPATAQSCDLKVGEKHVHLLT